MRERECVRERERERENGLYESSGLDSGPIYGQLLRLLRDKKRGAGGRGGARTENWGPTEN